MLASGYWKRQRFRLLLPLLALLSAVFVVLLIRAWVVQTSQSVACSKFLGEPKARNGYLEVQVEKQHPIEPTFDGQLFVYSLNPDDAKYGSVTITRSPDRTYGRYTGRFDLVHEQRDFGNETRFRKWEKFSLIAEKGLHRLFPYDSASFDFEIGVNPPVQFNVVRVSNRVPGLVMDCDDLAAHQIDPGKVSIRFKLERSPLVRLVAEVLCIAATLFLVMIVRLRELRDLAPTVASYFFSLWSIR